MIAQYLIRRLIVIWLAFAVLISVAAGIGSRLPSGDQMTYTNTADTSDARQVNIFIRDTSRAIERHLTDGSNINALAKWSPDGKKIAYLSLENGVFHVYVMDAVGHNQQRLPIQFASLDTSYMWSPDSQWLLFSVTAGGTEQSLIVHVTTNKPYTLAQVVGDAIWSPDSQTIVYPMAGEDGVTHLYGVNVACVVKSPTCNAQQLNFLPDQPLNVKPVWSPDGQAIAYSQFDQGSSKIIVLRLSCKDLLQTCVKSSGVIGHTTYFVPPIWSADSQALAFVVNPSEIRVVQLASNASHTYTISTGVLPALQNWSPDGRYIIYYAAPAGVANLYLLDTNNDQTSPLFPNQVSAASPDWRPTPH